MNYFSARSAAERYLKGRLFFHPMIVGRIRESLPISLPLSSGLDVGCGTGLSAVALREISGSVVGIDASAEMIGLAPKECGVEFVVAIAEDLPFVKCSFDLITLSHVFHWLDRDGFLAEARRVLRPKGWLVVYDDYFSAEQIDDNSEFRKWYREEYLSRYPSPPRSEITFAAENTERHGFRLVREERHNHVVGFALEGLVDYLVTQTNVIAAVEGGREEIDDARTRLTQGLRPIFPDVKKKGFMFNAPVWYLQRTA